MNEDGTPIAAPEAPAEGEQLETTTPEEVLQVMGKEAPAPEAEEPEQEPEGEAPTDPEVEPETPEGEEPAPVEATPRAEPAVADEQEAVEPPTFALDVEDAEGNTITINPGDNLEDVLKDFEPKSNGQIFQIIKDITRLEGEKSAWEAEQTTAAQEAERQEAIANVQATWEAEIAALQGEKRLPVGADGKSTERVDEVFKFIAEENQKRHEAGRPLIQSFEDALDKIELREKKEAEVQAAKDEKELAKKRGGLVGGSSAPATSGGKTYSGGARTANEAIRSMGLL